MAKILLVEDNEMNRDMLLRRLRRRGHEVSVALDGAECIEQVRSNRPELILMDMSLPVMDGYQATRILKEGAGTQSIPILGLSAHAMTGDADKALEAGCDDYDTKPVDLKRLLSKIDRLIGGDPGPGTEPKAPAPPAPSPEQPHGISQPAPSRESTPPLPPLPTLPKLPPLPTSSAPATAEPPQRTERPLNEPHPTVPLPADAVRAAWESLTEAPGGDRDAETDDRHRDEEQQERRSPVSGRDDEDDRSGT